MSAEQPYNMASAEQPNDKVTIDIQTPVSDFSADILRILSLVPDGLSVRKIVRHVYNAHNTLFASVPLDEVQRQVSQYLLSRSRSAASPIEHAKERGVYRLNPRSEAYHALRLQFKDEEQAMPETTPREASDTCPSLFD